MNVSKGELAKKEVLKKCFDTDNLKEVRKDRDTDSFKQVRKDLDTENLGSGKEKLWVKGKYFYPSC